MNSIKSIEKSVKIFTQNKIKFILLYCINLYPTSLDLVRLNAIQQYKKKFKAAVTIGYSDHTVGISILQ